MIQLLVSARNYSFITLMHRNTPRTFEHMQTVQHLSPSESYKCFRKRQLLTKTIIQNWFENDFINIFWNVMFVEGFSVIWYNSYENNNVLPLVFMKFWTSKQCEKVWFVDLSGPLKVSKSQKQILKFSFEPKTERKYFCISALASKIGQIKKIMAHYHAN